jgi:hypothetical protein
MLKILRRKVLKVIPVWLIIIMLAVGTGFAAFQWISNTIVGTVNVTVAPLTLSGAFTTTSYVNIGADSTFTYQVNSGTPTGYVVVSVSGSFTSASDVAASCYVAPTGFLGAAGVEVAGYPQSGTGWVQFCFGNTTSGGGPFAFGSTTGSISIYLTYHVLGSSPASIQVSSTSS